MPYFTTVVKLLLSVLTAAYTNCKCPVKRRRKLVRFTQRGSCKSVWPLAAWRSVQDEKLQSHFHLTGTVR